MKTKRKGAEPHMGNPAQRTAPRFVARFIPTLAVGVAIAAVATGCAPAPAAAPSTSAASLPTPSATPTLTPTPTPTPFDKGKHSIDAANSEWVVVNKQRPLNPVNYAPPLVPLNLPGRGGEMQPKAALALQHMFADYKAQTGSQLSVVSPYRSYGTQVATYASWVSRLGKTQADRQSARPGFSEHQTGLAVDIDTAISQSFGQTPAGKWLAKNSWKYGFIVRYPQGKEAITGYEYEPWHFRFVGPSLATEMHDEGIETLEEFFGLPAAPDYKN